MSYIVRVRSSGGRVDAYPIELAPMAVSVARAFLEQGSEDASIEDKAGKIYRSEAFDMFLELVANKQPPKV